MSSFYAMPQIDLSKLETVLSAEELDLVRGIVNSKTGALRASKPKIEYRQIRKGSGRMAYTVNVPEDKSGKTAYIWRMVAFMISPTPAHQCMPVMAFCDLPYVDEETSHAQRRELEKEMDALVDKVVDTVKPADWHGVRRWAVALGVVDRQAGEPLL